jgi:hypothetical protein
MSLHKKNLAVIHGECIKTGIENKKKIIYRAKEDYRKMGRWYDWCWVDWSLNEPILSNEKLVHSPTGEVLYPFPQYNEEEKDYQYDMYRCPARVLAFPRLFAKETPPGFDETIFLRNDNDVQQKKIITTWMKRIVKEAYNRTLSSDIVDPTVDNVPGADDTAFAIVHSTQVAPLHTKHVIGREYLLEHKRMEDVDQQMRTYLSPIFQSVPISSLGPICFCFEFTGMLKQNYQEAPKVIQLFSWQNGVSNYFTKKYLHKLS